MPRYRTGLNGRVVRDCQATVETVECPKEMGSGVSAHHVATREEPWRATAAGSGQSPQGLKDQHAYDASRGDEVGRWCGSGVFTS